MDKKSLTGLLIIGVILFAFSWYNSKRQQKFAPTETVAEVQEAIRTGERAGFGLAAVAERIALYYGPGYGMKIFSEEGKGTTVEIRLGNNIQP